MEVLDEPCSAITRVSARTGALSLIRDTHIRGFNHLVTLRLPVASGLEHLPGETCTYLLAANSHGRGNASASA